jgi:CubicO group peptidase (beta-lactamase class C family)
MIGAVPATCTCGPTTTALLYPHRASNADPDVMSRLSTGLVSLAVAALDAIDDWGARTAAAGVVRPDGGVDVHGASGAELRWASVTKLMTGLAVLVAVEEGTVDLDEPAGPEGSTLRHLLAHASGLPPDEGQPLMAPERRRIYSNYGIELAAQLVADRAGMPFVDYLGAAVLGPLGLRGSLHGSPAWGYRGPLDDLLALARELLEPTLVARETLDEATTVQFAGLDGVLPSWGRMEPNDWGLAFELRDDKAPHWTSTRNSPRTFGHFGAAGTFLWVDPELHAACGVLTDREFGDWAIEAWPRLNDAVVAELMT